MKLTALGSGVCIFKTDRKGPSFLLETDGNQKLLFDCGWGFGENLIKTEHEPADLDHIFISHPHADHLGSLINILQSIYTSSKFFPEESRTKTLTLHGYIGFKKDYETLRSILFPEREESYQIEVIEHGNDEKKYEGFKLTTSQVTHRPDLFHSATYRIDSGNKSFVYSGDCGYDERLVELSKDSDLLILDCSIPTKTYNAHGPQRTHLSPFECGQVGQKAQVKRLMLYHIYYDLTTPEKITNEIRKHYEEELILPRDLQTIEI